MCKTGFIYIRLEGAQAGEEGRLEGTALGGRAQVCLPPAGSQEQTGSPLLRRDGGCGLIVGGTCVES